MNDKDSLRKDEDIGVPCPECGLKHLRAALAAFLDRSPDDPEAPAISVDASQALVAFEEYAEGYTRHYDYAVGKTVLAEGALARANRADDARRLREARRSARRGGDLSQVMAALKPLGEPYVGHLAEAVRESPLGVMEPDPRGFLRVWTEPKTLVALMLRWIDQLESAFPDAREVNNDERPSA